VVSRDIGIVTNPSKMTHCAGTIHKFMGVFMLRLFILSSELQEFINERRERGKKTKAAFLRRV
jgi:hypothetical protein